MGALEYAQLDNLFALLELTIPYANNALLGRKKYKFTLSNSVAQKTTGALQKFIILLGHDTGLHDNILHSYCWFLHMRGNDGVLGNHKSFSGKCMTCYQHSI
jgi:hypothetical protein